MLTPSLPPSSAVHKVSVVALAHPSPRPDWPPSSSSSVVGDGVHAFGELARQGDEVEALGDQVLA